MCDVCVCVYDVADGCTGWYRWLDGNAGLCGAVVSVGTVGTSYNTDGTNLGNDCPTTSPTTSAPTVAPSSAAPTAAPSSAPTSSKPCCEELRANPVFCCMEAHNPDLMRGVCQECGAGK